MSTLVDAEIVSILILARTGGLVIRSRAVSAAGTAVLPSPDHMLV
ncbi:MAG: hypothetical protein ABR922_09385 [Streptosporangiaceae bacterium]|jgi:hypothetical protein